MLFPSSSAAAPLLALLLLLAAVSPPGAALELPSPLVDVAVLAMGAEPGSADALPMNAPQTEVRGRANARENRRLAAHDSSCMLQYLPVQPSGRTAAATREEPDRDDDGQQCSTRVRLLQARPDSRRPERGHSRARGCTPVYAKRWRDRHWRRAQGGGGWPYRGPLTD